MERVQALNRYQKGILLVMAGMVLVFALLTSVTVGRKGFLYQDAILVPEQKDGATVYSGRIQGQPARFTVSADKVVTFTHGETVYGPYTAQKDPSAIPEEEALAEYMTGVELRKGEEILFRGGVLDQGDFRLLYNADGTAHSLLISVTTADGVERDVYGNVIDPMEPTASTVLHLMAGPELTHKGDFLGWFAGTFLCLMTAVSILYAQELFRWNLSFRIRNPERAEPSEWEIAERYIAWTVMPLLALMLFVVGLQ